MKKLPATMHYNENCSPPFATRATTSLFSSTRGTLTVGPDDSQGDDSVASSDTLKVPASKPVRFRRIQRASFPFGVRMPFGDMG